MIWLVLVLGLTGVYGQGYTVVSKSTGDAPASDTVEVSCVFSNQWTAETHPQSYPAANAHYSPMIVASHNADYTMWADGQLASPAVQIVAETGVKLSLLGELVNSEDVLDQEDGRAMFMSNQQSFSLDAFTVNSEYPLISSITKISPSPDWITGFTNFSPIDSATNTYYDSFEIDTFPWDGGTDSRAVYRGASVPTDPPEPIFQLTADTVPSSGVFLSPDGTAVLPVAKWTCTVVSIGSGPPVAPTQEPTMGNIFGEETMIPTFAKDNDTEAPTASTPDVTDAPTAGTTAPSVETAPPTAAPTVSPTAGPTGSPTLAPTASPTAVPVLDTTDSPTSAPTADVIPYLVVSSQPSSTASSQAVGFSCTITNRWTAERHPRDYPTGAAQWSPMVLTSHNSNFSMWENGQTASIGLRSMAMTGSPDLLMAELDITDAGVILDQTTGSALNLTTSQNQTIGTVRLDAAHPYIAAATMVAPSPDWFSGFNDFNALDSSSNTWYQSFVIESFPWDAGTDSGTTYKAETNLTVPAERITQLTVSTVPDSGVFLRPDGRSVDPVARWACKQVEAPEMRTTSGSAMSSWFVTMLMCSTTVLFIAL